MSAFTVVLDAANIAFTKKGLHPQYHFRRVDEVRQVWLERIPTSRVHAVIDASAYRRMADQSRARLAMEHGWLETAPGDADDRILELADRYGAAIVSNDKFEYARDDYPWLQGCTDRVFSASWRKGELLLQPRLLRIATPEEIACARREKATKAGIRHDLGDRTWRCKAPPELCEHSGQLVPHSLLRERQDGWYCVCQYSAQEQYADLTPVALAGPSALAVLHADRFQHEVAVGPHPLVIGRGGQSRPHVHDVTVGLPRDQAAEVSREHLEIFLDDDSNPIVRHLAQNNATFLNPRLGIDGLPLNNRLADHAEYLVSEADSLLLGPGTVTLVIIIPREVTQ